MSGRRRPFLAGPMNDVVSGCVEYKCASAANSFLNLPTGIGNPDEILWENLEDTPADSYAEGSGPTWVGGILSAAPVFTGKAGQKGSYFLMDGTQDFFYNTGLTSASVAAGFHKDWHVDQDFTFFLLFKRKAGSNQTLCTTKSSGTTPGVIFYINASNQLACTQRGDTASVGPVTSTATLTADTIYAVSVSHSHSGNETGFRVGSSVEETPVSHTFNASTAAASNPFMIGASLDATLTTASLFMAANTEVYAYATFNAVVSDADAATIIAKMEADSGVDGTP